LDVGEGVGEGEGWGKVFGVEEGLDVGEGIAMSLKVYPHPSTPVLLISSFLPVLFI
jgi:hypothetical protein